MKMPPAPRFFRLLGFALLALAAGCWSGCATKTAPSRSAKSRHADEYGAVGASPSPIKINRQ